jgi:hypothetical protein
LAEVDADAVMLVIALKNLPRELKDAGIRRRRQNGDAAPARLRDARIRGANCGSRFPY